MRTHSLKTPEHHQPPSTFSIPARQPTLQTMFPSMVPTTVLITFVLCLVVPTCFSQNHPTDTGRSCPRGEYDTGNFCDSCPPQTVTETKGRFFCKRCKHPFYPDQYRQKCIKCRPGSYINEDNCCVECSWGSISTRWNSRSCTECPKGTQSNKNNTRCQPTPPLTLEDCLPYRVLRNGKCVWCPSDQVISEKDNRCKACAPGHEMDNARCESCDNYCSPCHSRDDDLLDSSQCYSVDNTNCVKCPKDSFPDVMAVACVRNCGDKPCPESCEPGYYRKARSKGAEKTCVKCPRNKISIRDSVTSCISCPKGLVSNTAHTKCVCPPQKGARGLCGKCPPPMSIVNGTCTCPQPGQISWKEHPDSLFCKCAPLHRLPGVQMRALSSQGFWGKTQRMCGLQWRF